jgi:RNA polymerase sigma-70 factor (ECF subfamily)
MTAFMPSEPPDDFESFVGVVWQRLGRALVAQHGVELGNDLCAEVLAFAWEHWPRVREMDNPFGYLYRVAQSAARPYRRWHRRMVLLDRWSEPAVVGAEPDEIFISLARLSEPQRVCVLLAHAYGWRYAEVAELLGVSVAAVTNHVHRGMVKLRSDNSNLRKDVS